MKEKEILEIKNESLYKIISHSLTFWIMFPCIIFLLIFHTFNDEILSYRDYKFPPVTNFEIVEYQVNKEENYINLVKITFIKHRSGLCVVSKDEKDHFWVNSDGVILKPPLGLRIYKNETETEKTEDYIDRPEGEQETRNWRIYGITSLDGVKGYASHFCGTSDSKRKVITQIYPYPNDDWWKYLNFWV